MRFQRKKSPYNFLWRAFLTATTAGGALAPSVAQSALVNNPDTLVYAITGDVDSLDPHWAYDGISQEVQYQIYETLLFYKGSSIDSFEPMLATVVPDKDNGLLSPDGLRYAFPIRKEIKFHDGSPLTPEDVKYSLMRFLFTDRASGPSFLLLEPLLGVTSLAGPGGKPDASLFKQAEEAVRVEDGAVVLRLKKPYAPLLSILAAFCPIISKSWTVKNGGWDGRGETWLKYYNPPKEAAALYDRANATGPFKLERWDKENKQIVLSRNEEYWRKPARLKHVLFRTVNEPATRKLMLQAGDADIVMMERQFLPQVAGLEGVTITDDLPLLEIHNAFVMNFKINAEANPYIGSGRLDGNGIPYDFFSDINVRKGLASAFDYDAYISDGYRGKGERARGPIPKGLFGYHSGHALHPYDLQKAAEHFQKAFGGQVWEKGFRFTITYMEGRADRQLACQILKKNVEALNPKFRIDVHGIQWSTWLSAYSAGKLPMANARWHMDYPDPHNAVFPFLHSQGYYAKAQGYSNPRADRLIEQARGELDRAKRKALYYELQAIDHADVPQIYTIDTYHFQVNRSWVKGWYYNPIVMYDYLYPVYKED